LEFARDRLLIFRGSIRRSTLGNISVMVVIVTVTVLSVVISVMVFVVILIVIFVVIAIMPVATVPLGHGH
jgi:hypothetical protein